MANQRLAGKKPRKSVPVKTSSSTKNKTGFTVLPSMLRGLTPPTHDQLRKTPLMLTARERHALRLPARIRAWEKKKEAHDAREAAKPVGQARVPFPTRKPADTPLKPGPTSECICPSSSTCTP